MILSRISSIIGVKEPHALLSYSLPPPAPKDGYISRIFKHVDRIQTHLHTHCDKQHTYMHCHIMEVRSVHTRDKKVGRLARMMCSPDLHHLLCRRRSYLRRLPHALLCKVDQIFSLWTKTACSCSSSSSCYFRKVNLYRTFCQVWRYLLNQVTLYYYSSALNLLANSTHEEGKNNICYYYDHHHHHDYHDVSLRFFQWPFSGCISIPAFIFMTDLPETCN